MWFHLWLLWMAVSDLSWLFIKQELLIFALLHSLRVFKMTFSPQTPGIPVCRRYIEEKQVWLTLFVWRYYTSSVKPSTQYFDNSQLEENWQIPYPSLFFAMFLMYNSLWKSSTPTPAFWEYLNGWISSAY